MSNYHTNEFLGFGTCAPHNFIPDWFYSFLFFPPIRSNRGVSIEAPYGLRKIEAQLLKEGFSVVTVDPDKLEEFTPNAKIIGIYTMDPFGIGPASSTLAAILKREPFLAQHFRGLLDSPMMKKARAGGAKVVVGGPGAWQFSHRPGFAEKHGIDCVVEGEAENVVGNLFRSMMRGEAVPKHVEVAAADAPLLERHSRHREALGQRFGRDWSRLLPWLRILQRHVETPSLVPVREGSARSES